MQEMEVDSWAGTARSITVHAAQTVTDFADASHSESAKSTTTTVLYGIFSSENSYPCTVTFPGYIKRGFSIILLTFCRSHSIIYGIEYYITGKNK